MTLERVGPLSFSRHHREVQFTFASFLVVNMFSFRFGSMTISHERSIYGDDAQTLDGGGERRLRYNR